jgi:large conductance mechanosensitive channel
MLREFQEFALEGNVLDMAVGIVIGAAFTGIVTSLVEDVIMPPIGVILGGIDFSDYFLQLTKRDTLYPTVQAARDDGAAVLAFGSFVNAVVKFLVVAFAVFLLVRRVNRLRRRLEEREAEKPAAPTAPPADILLLREIRDLLKARG